MDYFNIGEDDIWWDEATGTQHPFKSMNIHHVNGRGKGKDVIGNLMCLQIKTHARAHGTNKPVSKGEFQLMHNYFLQGKRIAFLT